MDLRVAVSWQKAGLPNPRLADSSMTFYDGECISNDPARDPTIPRPATTKWDIFLEGIGLSLGFRCGRDFPGHRDSLSPTFGTRCPAVGRGTPDPPGGDGHDYWVWAEYRSNEDLISSPFGGMNASQRSHRHPRYPHRRSRRRMVGLPLLERTDLHSREPRVGSRKRGGERRSARSPEGP
jgi:hypothetical protein